MPNSVEQVTVGKAGCASGMLRGVIPPMVTPMLAPGTLDRRGLERQVQRLIDAEVSGIFVLGTTGEGVNLPQQLKRDLVAAVTAIVDGVIPVIAGLTEGAIADAVGFAEYCCAHGVDAVAATPPSYFRLNQAELADYYRQLATRLPMPMLVYNIPSMTHTQIELSTIERLLEIPDVIGIKDSSGQMVYHHALIELSRRRDDFSVFIGPEELLADSVAAGGHGGVPAGANIWPELYVSLYRAASDGNSRRAAELRRQAYVLRQIYFQDHSEYSLVRGVKAALRLLGVCGDALSEPITPFERAQVEAIESVLGELGLLNGNSPVVEYALEASSAVTV